VPSNKSAKRLELFRIFFANMIMANAGVPDPGGQLKEAFASIPRERFLGKGPWRVSTLIGYIETPSDDPAFLYQDITVALENQGYINNGQPTLHALCLASLNIQEGETIIHIGAGTGYYTAVLAKLTGPAGSVYAFEIETRLAKRARSNLADLACVTVHNRSGSEGRLPNCDVIYVSAGATAPLGTWLDALRPGGRLLLPLTPDEGAGGMLLAKRTIADTFEAHFLCRATFIPCAGARDYKTAQTLSDAFRRSDCNNVQSLRRNTPPDGTCWCSGADWWLSTSPNP
jgi:protein-L-isoaspartate(D-aspartate) O-methyltransferase